MDLPYKFHDSREERDRRTREFQQLSSSERWKKIAEMFELGHQLIASSPDRDAIERYLDEQEAEWNNFQRKLFRRYVGGVGGPLDGKMEDRSSPGEMAHEELS